MTVTGGKLIDRSGIQDEYGLTRAAAEALMRQCVKVQLTGFRKQYVYRRDVERIIRESERPK